MSRRSLARSGYSAALLLVLFLVQSKANAADVGSLFQQARTIAAQLRRDAVTMESFTRSNLTWQSHGAQVTQIRNHINSAGSLLTEMQAARGDAKPWHQEAIDRIAPVLKELASNTESIITHLNSNPRHLRNPDYVQLLRSNAELATELSTSIGNTIDYDNTRTRIEALQAKIGQ